VRPSLVYSENLVGED